MCTRDKFKIETFYVIIEKLIIEIEKWKNEKSLFKIKRMIMILTDKSLKDNEEIEIKINNLVGAYKTNLESELMSLNF